MSLKKEGNLNSDTHTGKTLCEYKGRDLTYKAKNDKNANDVSAPPKVRRKTGNRFSIIDLTSLLPL